MIICIEKLVRAPLKSAASAVLSLGLILATTSVSPADESQDRKPLSNLKDIKHIIVIYQPFARRGGIDSTEYERYSKIVG